MITDDHPALTRLKQVLPDWRVYDQPGLVSGRHEVVAHHYGQRLKFIQMPGDESYSKRLIKLVDAILAHPKLRLSDERREALRSYQAQTDY